MTRFEVGTTYQTRSLCDWDCIYSFPVVARTAKTITMNQYGKHVRRGVFIDSYGVECCKPFGTYSMSPTFRANKTEA